MIELFITLALAAPSQQASSGLCNYDRTAMLALDQNRFDQDMNGGWRRLAISGCELAAADLIKDWRETNKSQDSILYWHEGQLRALAGQSRVAIPLLNRSRKTPAEDAGFGWNYYVDGTTAFLRGDRKGLRQARGRLAQLPRPKNYFPIGPDGKPISVSWPMNLTVLDGFAACWGQSYKKAYSCPKPTSKR